MRSGRPPSAPNALLPNLSHAAPAAPAAHEAPAAATPAAPAPLAPAPVAAPAEKLAAEEEKASGPVVSPRAATSSLHYDAPEFIPHSLAAAAPAVSAVPAAPAAAAAPAGPAPKKEGPKSPKAPKPKPAAKPPSPKAAEGKGEAPAPAAAVNGAEAPAAAATSAAGKELAPASKDAGKGKGKEKEKKEKEQKPAEPEKVRSDFHSACSYICMLAGLCTPRLTQGLLPWRGARARWPCTTALRIYSSPSHRDGSGRHSMAQPRRSALSSCVTPCLPRSAPIYPTPPCPGPGPGPGSGPAPQVESLADYPAPALSFEGAPGQEDELNEVETKARQMAIHAHKLLNSRWVRPPRVLPCHPAAAGRPLAGPGGPGVRWQGPACCLLPCVLGPALPGCERGRSFAKQAGRERQPCRVVHAESSQTPTACAPLCLPAATWPTR